MYVYLVKENYVSKYAKLNYMCGVSKYIFQTELCEWRVNISN